MYQALRDLMMIVGSLLAAVQIAYAGGVLDGEQSSNSQVEVQSQQGVAASCQTLLATKYSFLEALFLKDAPTSPYVRVHHRPSATQGPEGIRVAMFPKGTYRPEYEGELRKQGYFAAIQLDAGEADAAKNPDFIFGPQQVYWMQPAYLDQEFDTSTLDPKKQKDVLKWFNETDPEIRSWIMTAAPKSKDRSTLNKRLEVVGQKYMFEVAPLTLGDYERWNREIFQPSS